MLRPLALTARAMPATWSSVAALLGRRARDLLEQHGDADPAAAGRPGAVLHRHVVVGDDRLHVEPVSAAASSAAISKFITSPV